ncbi:MAG: PilZ domain-containing protein [Rhodocyclaceae bacterium]
MGEAHLMRRVYIRHPSDMPIELRSEDGELTGEQRLKDISLGGIACRAERAQPVGSVVSLCIASTDPPFRMRGRVTWCIRRGEQYDIGVQFLAQDDAFAARMVEQVCHIEQYRNDVLRREGRVLDSEEAAREWIKRFAPDFPDPRAMH